MNDEYLKNQALLDRWFEAVKLGDLDRVAQLLDSGLDVNTGDAINTTALNMAVGHGHLNLIRLLLGRGADPGIANSTTHSALTTALILSRSWDQLFGVRQPDPTTLEILLAAGAEFGLLEAVLLDDVDLARRRLDEGADPNFGDFSYHGPVLKLAAELGYLEMVDLLLDRGADIELTDDIGWRPLASAARSGQVEVVRRLLDRGADIDAPGYNDDSALGNAALEGQDEVVQLLFSRRARRGLFDALVLNDVAIFEALLDAKLRDHRKIDEITDSIGRRLAILAAGRGNMAILRILLDRGSAQHYEFWDQHSLLAEAARHGHLDAVRFLLDRGAEIHSVGKDGLSPLEWAIQEGRDEVAGMLRGAGPDR